MEEIWITILFTFVGIVGGGLVSWFVTAYYTKISNQGLEKFTNLLIQKIGEKDNLFESLVSQQQGSQKILDENFKISKSVIREANLINQKYKVHLDTSSLMRCQTCGSSSYWNGNRCMNCGEIDDGDF